MCGFSKHPITVATTTHTSRLVLPAKSMADCFWLSLLAPTACLDNCHHDENTIVRGVSATVFCNVLVCGDIHCGDNWNISATSPGKQELATGHGCGGGSA